MHTIDYTNLDEAPYVLAIWQCSTGLIRSLDNADLGCGVPFAFLQRVGIARRLARVATVSTALATAIAHELALQFASLSGPL